MSERISPLPEFFSAPGLQKLFDIFPEMRLVGGVVRDLYCGLPAFDIDLCTPEPPEVILQKLQEAGMKAVPTGLAHGTVTAVYHKEHYEITALRADVETDGRHAKVCFGVSFEDDAARRDFTFNALSLNRNGQIFDYFGGLNDLKAGIVRFVGNPFQRIEEDYLRVLRFFRFYSRFGRTLPDPETLRALKEACPYLKKLSAERVWAELKKILSGPDPDKALHLMTELGITAAILPFEEPLNLQASERLSALQAPPDPLLRLAALLPGEADRPEKAVKLAKKLRFSKEEARLLRALVSFTFKEEDFTSVQEITKLLADYPADFLAAAAFLSPFDQKTQEVFRTRLREIPPPVFPLQGADILAAGVSQGPQTGYFLNAVREWWLQENCIPDKEACLTCLAMLLKADKEEV